MTISMFAASVPVAQTALNNLIHLLDKAQAHAQAKAFDAGVFTHARLAPDMLPLPRQVMIACDTVKLGLARLSGVEAPKFDDVETTLDELKARIQKTLDYIQTLRPEQIDGSEGKAITFNIRERVFNFTGQDYLTQWLLPNLYFHVTTAYAILRHNGVGLGKADYLRGSQQ